MSSRRSKVLNNSKDIYGSTDPKMKRKLAGLFIAVVLALVAIAVRISYISASNGEKYAKEVLAQSQSKYSSTVIPFKRGDITDRNGTVIATSQKMYNVILDCNATNYKEEYYEPTVQALVANFNVDENTVRHLLTDEETKDSRYKIVYKNATIEEKKAFEEYEEKEEHPDGENGEKTEKIAGVWFEEEYVRYYPFNELACSVIGFTNEGNTADWGIEGYYNNSLNGVNGRKFGYFNSDTNLEQTIVDAVDGNSVVSTIDMNVQAIVEDHIKKYMSEMSEGTPPNNGAANVGVIIMDPKDFSVIAMAGSRSYDLNQPRDLSGYFSSSQISAMSDDQKTDNLNSLWRNYCISDTFEPGSTFKPMVIAAALEDGTLSGSETYNCDGFQVVSGTTIKCADVEGHGEETLSDVIMNSCNDAMMQIVDVMGIDEFCRYQELFNFGRKTGIDLSGEASGILYSASAMGDVDLATSSFGQGFNVNMIQETAAFCSVVNGGYYYRPRVVEKITDTNGNTVTDCEPVLLKQVISEDVSAKLRSYLKSSVDSGTSIYAKVDGYSSGGKTGTAQKIPRGSGKYLVSFIGFWPYDDPEVVCYVVVDEPNAPYQANSAFAQVVARDIMKETLPYLNIYPDETIRGITYLDLEGAKAMEGETQADINVPEAAEDTEVITGGNNRESDGYTNDEIDIEDEE